MDFMGLIIVLGTAILFAKGHFIGGLIFFFGGFVVGGILSAKSDIDKENLDREKLEELKKLNEKLNNN